jgi:hypothetical protein
MAITYLQQPASQSIQATDNPIVFQFSSNQTTQANFCFIVETLLNGLVVSTDKVFPERGNRAHWDASKISMTSVKPTLRTTGIISMQTLPQLTVRVAERYGTTPVTQAFSASNTIKLLKARCSDEDYQLDWIEDTYVPDEKWLTEIPEGKMIVSKKYPIYASILTTDAAVQVEAYCYDATGNLLGIVSEQSTAGGDKVNVQITPQDIIAEIAPASIDELDRLEIYMNQSEALTAEFVPNECTEFHQLNWMNKLGTYDQFLFGHNHDQETAISALEYKKQFGAWNSSNVFQFDPLTSGDTTYTKIIQPTGIVYTGWISQEYQNWLAQIYYSINTILFEEDKTYGIVVTETKSMKMQSRFDELLNFQVSYKKSNFKSITQ